MRFVIWRKVQKDKKLGVNAVLRRTMLKGVAASAAAGVLARYAGALEVLKMGISIPLTGERP